MLFIRPPPHFKVSCPNAYVVPQVKHVLQPVIILAPYISSASSRSAEEQLEPFRTKVKPLVDNIVSAPDQLTASHANDAALSAPARRLTIRGTAYSDLWTDMLTQVWNSYCTFTEETPDAKASMVIWEPRGLKKQKLTEIAPDATAFHLRIPHHSVAIQGR